MKRFFIFFLLSILIFSLSSCSSKKSAFKFNAINMKVALVLSGSVSDSTWNEGAYRGLKKFVEDSQAEIAVVEKVALSEAKEVFIGLAERKFDLIIGYSYEYGFILKKIAMMYPDSFFCVLGGEFNQEPNLCSFNFKDEQYGYLIGIIAGLNTTTNKVGIVLGKRLPSMEKVVIGLRKGLKAVNPKADLVVSYINTWNDIAKGREAAVLQINTGIDVITHLADNSGIGVIKAAEEADISVIGAITDQHDLAPNTIISSGIQDISQLVYLVCEYYMEKTLEPKIYRFGLRNQVIDIAPSYGNIDPTTETRINRIKAKLIELEGKQLEAVTKKEKKHRQ